MAKKKDYSEETPFPPRDTSGLRRPRVTLDLEAKEEKTAQDPAPEPAVQAAVPAQTDEAPPAGAAAAESETPAAGGPPAAGGAVAEESPAAASAGAADDRQQNGGGDAQYPPGTAPDGTAPSPEESSGRSWGVPGWGAWVAWTLVAAGIAAVIAIAMNVGGLFGPAGVPPEVIETLGARLAKLEQRAGGAPAPQDAQALAAVGERLAALEQAVKALPGLSAEQDRLARETRALAAKPAGPGTEALEARLARLEQQVMALSAALGGANGPAASPEIAALPGRTADIESRLDAAQNALNEVKARLEAEVQAALKPADAAALAARLAAAEQKLAEVAKTEDSRRADAGRILTMLALASLERAIERGDGYGRELADLRMVSAGRWDLSVFDRFSDRGVPPLSKLRQEFPAVAEALLAAAKEPSDGSVLSQLMAGAQSVVRVRKVEPEPDDASADAAVSRMERAVEGGRLADALAEAGKLPPAVQDRARGWLDRAEGRLAVERAMAAIENELRASLAGIAAPPARAKE